jgi:hypothetical protein
MSYYLDKYEINNINDIIGNQIFIKDFKNWLNNKKKYLFCVGENGIGRTKTCEILMNKNNIDVYNYCDISYDKNINEHLKNYFDNNSIKNFFEKKQKILFIDDIDTYKSNILKNILNIHSKCKSNIKIICVLHKNNLNKYKEYNKTFDTIWFNKPNFNIIYKYIINILDDEDINIGKNFLEKLKKYIIRFNCNIKTILLNLEIFLDNLRKNNIKDEDNNIVEITFEKNIFENSELLFKKKLNIHDIDYINAYTNPSIFTMIIYDNLLNIIELYYKQYENILKKYIEGLKKKKDKNYDAHKKFIELFLSDENKNNIIKKIYKKILIYYGFSYKIENHLYKMNINDNYSFYKYIYFIRIFVINYFIMKFKKLNKNNIDKLKLNNFNENINLNRNIKFTNMLLENNQKIIFNKKILEFKKNLLFSFNENDYIFLHIIKNYLIKIKIYLEFLNNKKMNDFYKIKIGNKKTDINKYKINKYNLLIQKNGLIKGKNFDIIKKYNEELNILDDNDIKILKKFLI